MVKQKVNGVHEWKTGPAVQWCVMSIIILPLPNACVQIQNLNMKLLIRRAFVRILHLKSGAELNEISILIEENHLCEEMAIH